jgi:hypothetical protein
MSPPPVDTPPLMTQDTSPSKNRMRRGFGSSGRTLSLVHFCIQNAKFKAFSLNEMKAMVQIVAESEFVCAKRLRIFLERFLVCYYLQDPSGWRKTESRRCGLCLRALRYTWVAGARSQDPISSAIRIQLQD